MTSFVYRHVVVFNNMGKHWIYLTLEFKLIINNMTRHLHLNRRV